MKTIISFVAAFFWILLLAETSLAADWYCSTSAQGAKNGTSWANAWACDSNAPNPVVWGTNGVKAGDSLYIDGGPSGLTYTATAHNFFTVGASGTSNENRITIATGAKSPNPSGHDGQVTFDGQGLYINLINGGVASYITFDGEKNGTRNWKLYNTAMGGSNPPANLACSQHVIFTYIEIEKCNSGVYQMGCGAIGGEFSYLYIHDLRGYAGIALVGTNPGQYWYDQTFVHHNIIEINSDMLGSGPGADGIEGCHGLTLYNNVFNHVLGPLDEKNPGDCNKVPCNPPECECNAQHSDEIQVQAKYVKIYNNVFKNPTDSAIDVDIFDGSAVGWLYIYNNLFYVDNLPVSAPTGIRIYNSWNGNIPSLTDLFIYGNTFVDLVGSRAITIGVGPETTATNVHIKNNIIYDVGSPSTGSGFHAIFILPSNNATAADYGVDYNLVRAGQYGNAKLTIDDQDNYVQPHGYTDIDPTFVSYSFKSQSNDFHLSASDTGARDRGVALGPPFNVDKDGNSRPQGSAWDIGAYEYVSGPPAGTCYTSTSAWQNFPLTYQNNIFTIEFDDSPNTSGNDGVTGLSSGIVANYPDLAVSVRFNTNGIIDAINGNGYSAGTSIYYTPGKYYHFRLVINIPNHRYDIYVTPEDSSEITLGTNYNFRTRQANVPSLNNFGFIDGTGGSHTVCNFQITSQNPTSVRMPLSFDWRNRHGENWLTSIKTQTAGNCFAYATIGTVEAAINLYYNQHLDIDISEQDAICGLSWACVWGGNPNTVLDKFTNTSIGIVDEACFPTQTTCDDICSTLNKCADWQSKTWFLESYTPITQYDEETLKRTLIEKGPFIFDIVAPEWGHIVVLVGFDQIKQGDLVYTGFNSYSPKTVTAGDPLIGQNAWIIKNSYGTWWGDNGYGKVVLGQSDLNWLYYLTRPYFVNSATYQISCVDEDNDNYCNWGISSAKPASCPSSCSSQKDCDDSNPSLGPYDANYNCMMACIHKSDSDCDGCVSQLELINFINLWYLNSSNPTLKELMEAIGLWKMGGC